ncbi:MAG: tRNA pseudouridine(55) synthase TruB [bacterium]|nr:tRNA pseudouridine(55) synthase TruB [bacterium]
MDGVLLIDKPSGITSFDVIRQLRKCLGVRKMGHLGTLDPLATGLLVVFLGKATKLIPYLTEAEKEYVVDLELGKTSDSYDVTGEVKSMKGFRMPTQEEFSDAVQSFLGPQLQIQPPFSAIRIQGKRAYELARDGKQVDLGKRQVSLFEIQIMDFTPPFVQLRLHCSSGTYVRSFVHELGEKLVTGAIMTQLMRTRVNKFSLEQAHRLDHVGEKNVLDPLFVVDEYGIWEGKSDQEKAYLKTKLSQK